MECVLVDIVRTDPSDMRDYLRIDRLDNVLFKNEVALYVSRTEQATPRF